MRVQSTTIRYCSIEGCKFPLTYVSRGLCNTHYQRLLRRGELPPVQPKPVICSVESCGLPHYGRGLCAPHWKRWSRHGDPLGGSFRRGLPLKDRFWQNVDTNGPVPEHRPGLGPCWLWGGTLTESGYGRFRIKGGRIRAHHFTVGKPPRRLEWDHLCRVRNCVRPDHLELVTHAENMARTKSARGLSKALPGTCA